MFVIPTYEGNVAFSIALGVLLLSVVVQPMVKACFNRIRGDRAWQSIERTMSVDVTKYSIFAEALGDRGKWDTTRVFAIVTAAYTVCTWGLELSLDLALVTDGPVDLLNRPPPVIFNTHDGAVTLGNATDWKVLDRDAPANKRGTLKNFKGSMQDGYATTVYRIGGETVRGSKEFAWWSTDASSASSELFYDLGGGTAAVHGVACSTSWRKAAVHVTGRSEQAGGWGTAIECESGPRLINDTLPEKSESPPTILLNRTDGDAHLLVEEDASYPSFLYSVWELGSIAPGSVELRHVFHVSSTTRLVEAIMTGIVNGIENGGGCVDLMLQFSLTNTTYGLSEGERVSPFGEHPESSSVERMDDVEAIVAGVQVHTVGATCGFLLIGVTVAAFVGCLWNLKHHSPLDVFDRDALIKAVTAPTMEATDAKPTKLKVFVTREEDDRFRMVVSDDGIFRGCAGLRQRWKKDGDTPVESPALPRRGISRTWSLPMASMHAALFGAGSDPEAAAGARWAQDREHQVHAPAPSHATTFVELDVAPVRSLSRRASVLRGFTTCALEVPPSARPTRVSGTQDQFADDNSVADD